MNTSIELFSIGKKVSIKKFFTKEDVLLFAQISGDHNPVHLDEAYAQTTQFGACIVHGLLVASLFSYLLGCELPGPGAIYLGQSLAFKGAVYVGEEVTATAEVIHLREDKPIMTLKTLCTNAKGVIVVEGEAVVKYV